MEEFNYLQSQINILQHISSCFGIVLAKFKDNVITTVCKSNSLEKHSSILNFNDSQSFNHYYNNVEFNSESRFKFTNTEYIKPIIIDECKWGVIILFYEKNISSLTINEKEYILSISDSIRNHIKVQNINNQNTTKLLQSKQIIDLVKGIPWNFDFKTKEFKFVGSQIKDILGYTPEDWAAIKDWAKCIHQDDKNAALKVYFNGIGGSIEYRLIKKEGSTIWVRDIIKVIKDTEGNICQLVGLIFDISDLKKTQEEITFNNNQIKKILHHANTTLDIVDEDLNIIFHSNTDASAINKKCYEYFCNYDKQCEECPAISNNYNTNTFCRKVNGATYQVSAFPIESQTGKINIAEIRVDITEQVKKENELRKLKEKLEFSMNTGKIAYFEYNINTNHFKCNKYFSLLTGYDLCNTRLNIDWVKSRIHKSDINSFNERFSQIINSERYSFNSEYRFLNHNNKYLWLHFLGQIDKNEPTRLFGIIHNISENKKLLNELIDARNKSIHANELKSKFLANMSHEIRTPMNAIMGYTNILTKHINDDSLKKYISSINSSGKVLLNLINDLLDLEKINSGKMSIRLENTNLDLVIEDIKQTFYLLAQEKNVQLEFTKKTPIPEIIMVDSLKIKQILINLINNAIKFTHTGTIQLQYSFLSIKDSNTGSLNLSVIDTGMGIAPEKQREIFDPFIQDDSTYTKEETGTGLGLSIVQKLIGMMEGSIVLESEQNKGSKFIITIPNIQIVNNPNSSTKWNNNQIKQNIIPKVINKTKISASDLIDRDQEIVTQVFEHKILPIHNELKDLFSYNKAQALVNELNVLEKNINWKELSEYTKELNILIKTFDFESIPKHLNTFNEFILCIENYIPDNI